eukprot:3272460-Pyramimonas_sp.AAC.1
MLYAHMLTQRLRRREAAVTNRANMRASAASRRRWSGSGGIATRVNEVKGAHRTGPTPGRGQNELSPYRCAGCGAREVRA